MKWAHANAGGQLASEFEWNDQVVPHVHSESVTPCTSDRRSVISKSLTTSKYLAAHSAEVVFKLQFIEIVRLLVRSPRNKSRCEHLPKAWVVRAPSEAHQGYHRLAHFFLSRSALLSAERERAVQNKV